MPKSYWPFLVDALRDIPGVEERRMFGCLAFYRAGKLMVVLTGEDDEPWNGLMVCAERTAHPDILAEFPELASHPVLGKWLYLSCADSAFERVGEAVVGLVAAADPRLGTVPKPKKRRRGVVRKRQKSR